MEDKNRCSQDPGRVKLSRPDTSACRRKPRTIAVLGSLSHSTPCTRPTIKILIPAFLVWGSGVGAARRRVQSHLVRGHQVDSFYDVDFTVVGPERAFGPERWPYGASEWHVVHVDDPETAPVVEVEGFYADLNRVESDVKGTRGTIQLHTPCYAAGLVEHW